MTKIIRIHSAYWRITSVTWEDNIPECVSKDGIKRITDLLNIIVIGLHIFGDVCEFSSIKHVRNGIHEEYNFIVQHVSYKFKDFPDVILSSSSNEIMPYQIEISLLYGCKLIFTRLSDELLDYRDTKIKKSGTYFEYTLTFNRPIQYAIAKIYLYEMMGIDLNDISNRLLGVDNSINDDHSLFDEWKLITKTDLSEYIDQNNAKG